MTESIPAEIIEACRETPLWVYKEYGLGAAIVWVLSMPVVIPIAAVFYFSMDADKRSLLDESEEFIGS